MTKASLTVARVMKELAAALARVGAQATMDCTIRSRASGRDIDVNDQATRLTGFTRAALLRRSVWDLTPIPSVEEGRWASSQRRSASRRD